MLSNQMKPFWKAITYCALSMIVTAMGALAQDSSTDPPPSPQPATPGWHRFSPPPQATPPAPSVPQAEPTPAAVPGHITIPAGTFVTVRADQFLSSDKNKAGDGFSATLFRPLVAGGLVVSRPGQTLGGHVIEAKKAGRVKGVSHLQIGLNTMTLADGQQIPIQTELVSINGNTSNGRDASAIAMTTATGAAIGAAADWGVGAAIGGGAGLIASTVGVLVTRGHPTIIYPEARLTFRLAKPVTFSTGLAPQAFAPASTANYNTRAAVQGPTPANRGCRDGGYGCAPYPPPYYYGPYYPYYWGPSFGFYYGRGFYGRGFYGRGFHR
jgi:hypothetical protein